MDYGSRNYGIRIIYDQVEANYNRNEINYLLHTVQVVGD